MEHGGEALARCNGAPLTDNLQGPSLPLLAPCQPCCPSGVAAFVFVSLERSSAFAASGSWVCPSARLAARKPALSLWANWLYLLSLLCRAGVCLCCCCFAYRFRAGVLFLCLPSSQGLPRFPLEPKQGWAVILGTERFWNAARGGSGSQVHEAMGCSGGQALCRGVLQAGLLLLATPEASCRSSAAQSVFSACPPWQESRWMPAMAACHTCRPLLLLSDSAAQNPANFCNSFFFA